MVSRRDEVISTGDAPLAEILNALGREGVVVPLPGEAGLDESLGRQALQSLDDLEIGNVKLLMFCRVEVLLRDKNTLYKQYNQFERQCRIVGCTHP